MNELKAGRLAVTYAGCFLGAGFVSGQELWQFFGVFGVRGYMGFALSAVLFFLLGVLLVRLTQLSGINEMDTVLIPWEIPWLRKTVGVIEAVFLFGMVTVMTAGAGALACQLTGIPAWLFGALFGAAVAVAAMAGLKGMVHVFSALVPVLAVATVCFAVAAWTSFGTAGIWQGMDQNTNPLMPNWFIAALTYVAYNLLGSIGIITPIGGLVKRQGTVYAGIGLSCLMLCAIAGSVLTSLAAHTSAAGAELPMLALACDLSPALGKIYGVLLLLGMFGNSLASLVALTTYLEQKKPVLAEHRKVLTAGLGAGAWAGSLAGFAGLIGVVFPVFGYISIALLVCMVIHFVQCKKKEKTENAAGG